MEKWAAFFASCMYAPVDIPHFNIIATKLSRRHLLPPAAVADALYRPTSISRYSLSAQGSVYTYALLKLDLLDVPSILRALFKYSTFRNVETPEAKKESETSTLRWKKSYSHEEVLMFGLSKMVLGGTRPKSKGEAIGIIKTLVDWMKLLVMAQASDDMMQSVGAGSDSHNQETTAVKLSVGALLLAATESKTINDVLKKSCPNGKCIRVVFLVMQLAGC